MPLYLGFDAGTQHLTAIVLSVESAARRVAFEASLHYDTDLPQYRTVNGVLPDDDPLVARSSPLLWADALDRLMAIVARDSGLDLSRLRAISGSAQQHGSVYLTADAAPALARLDPRGPLVDQLVHVFARDRSPVWMDASTSAQCAAIEAALGGPAALGRLTGSRAFERFTGPQIRKYFETDPAGYARTARIHLVSSYLASLLAGAEAPIDPGDGAGTNLMDLATRRWAPSALRATAPDLARRLPPILPSWTVVGTLAPYWRERYGLPPANVVAWSGDNPCSLIGTGIVRPGRVAVSLGTSDTIFGYLTEPRVDPSGASHVFGAPTGDWMSLICFRNGSLARQRVRDAYGLDWDGFARALDHTPPGNGGAMMLPWFEAEITPQVLRPGTRRFGLDPADPAANVRAVVEAQMLAMRLHSAWMGERLEVIHATGGAAASRPILQVMADIFGAAVRPLEVANSAALGAALRAWHAADTAPEGREIRGRTSDAERRATADTWERLLEGFVMPKRGVHPRPECGPVYQTMMEIYATREREAHRL